MQFIDLQAQYQRIAIDVQARMQKVFAHGQFILGPEVTEVEEQMAKFVGVRHCITVSSGTDALLVALMALDIQPGDEVITTPFTFVATASMVKLLGAKPIFVDIDPKTYNIDPAQVEAAITDKTRVILPVNLYGQCADLERLEAIARKHNLYLIEDAAQSFGASLNNRRSCSFGHVGLTSFFPAKPLGCYGEGGACYTNNDEIAHKIRLIRHHGQASRYHHVVLGLNARFDTLQAAVLLAKMAIFPDELAKRAVVAARYDELLKPHVDIPYIAPGHTSVYAQYTIEVNDREQVQSILNAAHIPTAVHYPVPLHLQPVFDDQCYQIGVLKHAEVAADHVLSLPFHPYLTEEDQQRVAQAVVAAITADVS
ncbi:MAG: DegT/DnrJ/EryC1/StrS family aminotransferase [Pseudomonadota bacterium]|nr:DegT/DnrJ/EryC1/StrS family aminotransferase [Pseudomonadota bacterium]